MDIVQRYYVILIVVNLILMLYATWAKEDLNVESNKRPVLFAIGCVYMTPIMGRVFGAW